MPASAPIAVLVVAAGTGSRAGEGLPKQYRLLGGQSVLSRTLAAFRTALPDAPIQVVVSPDHAPLIADLTARFRLLPPTRGGASRQESVRFGLRALAHQAPAMVLVHDAARPFVSPDLIRNIVDALADDPDIDGVAPALAIADSIKKCTDDGAVVASIPRAGLWRMQTPQAFRFNAIYEAHEAAATDPDLTDDFAVAEAAGLRLRVIPGDDRNFKLTTVEDFRRAEAQLMLELGDIRTGQGFDVHAVGPGDHVMLCGVRIDHNAGLIGHSDADVGLHALTDAILGCAGAGDIGAHFPPSDPKWKGASSDLFLAHAARLVEEKGGVVAHVDVTLVCEAPKIAPHRGAMIGRIADILGIAADRVSVKATTTERLGFAGRGEGIAALATATVRLPIR
ncbi:MAG: bifunctional 2-C-methyl-D-erythritol 4-phosphate cytidylyltransferase/2-C-methyl-D-erythritol 2,4-cyclodiphosphate synthase [Alphaproteobacteria bacterium]|nr:bifunctional 2-C-methyl-D-erythritol 4-phosphate cytidylyltransferase/2-C-methyl-D-erythritol 2,4-cyclodiphosphate synthase [Alphaproteobacteria bacterium]